MGVGIGSRGAGLAVAAGIAALAAWRGLGGPWGDEGYAVAGLAGAAAGPVLVRLAVLGWPGYLPVLVPRVRRARHRRRGGTRPEIPARLRRAVLAADRRRCVYCGGRTGLQLDHITPWAAGGLSTPGNLAVLCAEHNRVKSNYRRDDSGRAHYRPWPGAADITTAATVLAAERRCQWSPARWARLVSAR